MNHQEKLLVASAIEKLTAQEDTSFDSAQIVIDAFRNLRITGASVSIKSTKTGDSVEGLTEHGNVSLDPGEQTSTHEVGIYKERVGKWVVTRKVQCENIRFWRKHNLLFIHHFLYQDTGSETHRRYFLEFDASFQPVAFGYIGDPEYFISIGNFSIYLCPPVLLLGKTTLPKEGPVISYRNPD